MPVEAKLAASDEVHKPIKSSRRVAQDGLSEEKQAAEVRSLILVAEKNSYQDAERQGLLDEDDWRNIAARINAELLALKLKLMAP